MNLLAVSATPRGAVGGVLTQPPEFTNARQPSPDMSPLEACKLSVPEGLQPGGLPGAILGGLLSSTALNMIVVPALYGRFARPRGVSEPASVDQQSMALLQRQ